VTAEIKTSFAENINFLNITCDKGEIKITPYQSYAGVRGTSPLGEINFPYSVPWQQAKQMDDDCLSIINNQPMQVPGEEGQRDIRIVEAVYAVAKTGKRVKL
jgi:glucose-fructose oxidoreductase